MDPLLSRITTTPGTCHGKPCIRGMRYPVVDVLDMLSSGMTHEEILADFDELNRDDLLAAIAYAGKVMRLWWTESTALSPDGNRVLRPTAMVDGSSLADDRVHVAPR